jgi:hyperosmotically inducible periplasmic protein
MRLRLIPVVAAFALTLSVGCSQQRANNPSVKDNVENSLKQAGFDKVNVDEDRDKGVVTLKGDVATMADKQRAEETARAAAGNNVIANELLVTAGDEDRAEKVSDKGDDAIESSFEAYVAENKLDNQHVRAESANGVLTLTGDVDTEAQRATIEKDAAKLPGVTQVVNKLDVKASQKADRDDTRKATSKK